MDVNLKEYPTTRYQGSKRKILPWIHSVLKEIPFHTALDGCGGSASVSFLLKKMGKSVTYNDSLKFNYLIGKALIENQNVKFSDEDIANLFDFEKGDHDIVNRLFKGIYYLDRENRWLDNMGFGIMNMNHYRGHTLELKKAIAYYALFQACLIKRPFNLFHRKNLDIRTADVTRNFGNKTTWEKSFSNSFKSFIKEVNSTIFDSGVPCRSINESIFDLKRPSFDLVYLDPPYLKHEGSNETSNYLKCYHFLEGLVNYDTWESMIDKDTANLRLSGSSIEPHFNKESIYESMDILIQKYRKSKIVISYKKGGIPSIEYLVKTMKKHKKEVYTKSQQYSYALNRQNDADKNREVLIIGI